MYIGLNWLVICKGTITKISLGDPVGNFLYAVIAVSVYFAIHVYVCEW